MSKTNQTKRITKKLTGVIIKLGSNKTATVKVERKYAHPLYKKIVVVHKNYLVDTKSFKLNIDDKVLIEESKPISKQKKFVVKQVLTIDK